MGQSYNTYRWHEIDLIPSMPGIYAWYYRIMLTAFDIANVKKEVESLRSAGKMNECMDVVRHFLQTHLFDLLKEEPYEAKLSGPLKPQYDGLLHNKQTVSDALLRRIAEDPGRLDALKKVLEASVPHFASPIYIGMSTDLKARVQTHKLLIERYRASEAYWERQGPLDETRDEAASHSFARDVTRRGLSMNRLEVAVRTLDHDTDEDVKTDAENILNRINHPILGRN